MIDPVFSKGKSHNSEVRVPTQAESLITRAWVGQIRIGSDAAREIAQRIESEGGFWGPRTCDQDYGGTT